MYAFLCGQLLGQEVKITKDCIGADTAAMVEGLPNGGCLLLENVRFYPEGESLPAIGSKPSHGGFFSQKLFVPWCGHYKTIDQDLPTSSPFLIHQNAFTILFLLTALSERPLTSIAQELPVSMATNLLSPTPRRKDGLAHFCVVRQEIRFPSRSVN